MADQHKENLNLLFGVRRSIRYHNRRRRFFESLNAWLTILSILSGSVAVVGIISEFPITYVLLAASFVTLLQILELVVRPVIAAREHSDLAQRFNWLERKFVSKGRLNASLLRELTVDRLEIEKDEPTKLLVLDMICHNELARSEGYGKRYYVGIPVVSRFLAHFFDLRASAVTDPEYYDEKVG